MWESRRVGNGGRRDYRHLRDESVTNTGQRLNKAWFVSRFAKRCTQTLDSGIQTILEADKGAGLPHSLAQLLSCHDRSASLHKREENGEGLPLYADASPMLSQLAPLRVVLEVAKAEALTALGGRTIEWSGHSGVKSAPSITRYGEFASQ